MVPFGLIEYVASAHCTSKPDDGELRGVSLSMVVRGDRARNVCFLFLQQLAYSTLNERVNKGVAVDLIPMAQVLIQIQGRHSGQRGRYCAEKHRADEEALQGEAHVRRRSKRSRD